MSTKTPSAPSSVQPRTDTSLSTNTNTHTESHWNIGQGFVFCPHRSHSKTRISFSNIEKHIRLQHPEMLNTVRLCPVCQVSVLLSKVKSHRSSCTPQGSALYRSVPNFDNETVSSLITAASVTPTPSTQQSSSASSAPVQVYWNIGKP